MKGFIQVYTGNGKGKTTAALGVSLRAVGAGKKVYFAQFVKGKPCSETEAVRKYIPNMTVKQYGLGRFIGKQPGSEDIRIAGEGLTGISRIIESREYDVVVLDEAIIAIYYNLFSTEELLAVLQKKPEETEVIVTGRYAPPELISLADLVTEMKEIKHYFTKGVKARKGIEY